VISEAVLREVIDLFVRWDRIKTEKDGESGESFGIYQPVLYKSLYQMWKVYTMIALHICHYDPREIIQKSWCEGILEKVLMGSLITYTKALSLL
jgi:hypothetical protein